MNDDLKEFTLTAGDKNVKSDDIQKCYKRLEEHRCSILSRNDSHLSSTNNFSLGTTQSRQLQTCWGSLSDSRKLPLAILLHYLELKPRELAPV